MKRYKSILAIFTVLLLVSFSDSNKDVSLERLWVFDSFEDGTYTYISKKKFDKDKSGYQFQKNGILKAHLNLSWCATPPISYSEVKGSWSISSDSIIEMQYNTLREKVTPKLKIIKLSTEKLTFKYIK